MNRLHFFKIFFLNLIKTIFSPTFFSLKLSPNFFSTKYYFLPSKKPLQTTVFSHHFLSITYLLITVSCEKWVLYGRRCYVREEDPSPIFHVTPMRCYVRGKDSEQHSTLEDATLATPTPYPTTHHTPRRCYVRREDLLPQKIQKYLESKRL